MSQRLSRAWAGIVVLGLIAACGRGDSGTPGRVSDLTFIWDAESFSQAEGRVRADNPASPVDTRILAWTAPGDDGSSGEASLYDLRYFSQSDLDEKGWTPEEGMKDHFGEAKQLFHEPKPSAAGSVERWFVERLDVSELYYFALLTKDEVDQRSEVSNLAGPVQLSLLGLELSTSNGPEAGLGSAVSAVQDFNGDGMPDLAVGSPLAGKVYLYPGAQTSDLMEEVTVSGLKVEKVKSRLLPKITFLGNAADEFGAAVAGVGKVDEGNNPDLAVGAPGADSGAGRVDLFYGASQVQGNLTAANAGAVIRGDAPGDRLGTRVVALGDLNQDGFEDFGVTAPGAGKVFVFLGGDTDSKRGPLPTGQTASAAAALVLAGETVEGFGEVIAGAGDLNGDGVLDLAVAAPRALHPDTGVAGGAVYIFYGGDAGQVKFKTALKAAGSQKVLDFRAGAKADVTLLGTAGGEGFGAALCSAGDLFNRSTNDTATDLAVGAPGMGQVLMFYAGSAGGKLLFPPTALGVVWEDQDRNLVLEGDTADGFGEILAGAGDINLDGYDDLVVGLPGSEAVRIYFWSQDQPVAEFHRLLLSSSPGSGFGFSLAPAGDLNQDGYADLMIGAPLAGAAYLEF